MFVKSESFLFLSNPGHFPCHFVFYPIRIISIFVFVKCDSFRFSILGHVIHFAFGPHVTGASSIRDSAPLVRIHTSGWDYGEALDEEEEGDADDGEFQLQITMDSDDEDVMAMENEGSEEEDAEE
jgi:hypothetical protein